MNDSSAPSPLQSLQVVLTNSCNLSCSYCYQRSRRGTSMRWEVLRAALDLVIRSGYRHPAVSFQGGEPLLEFDLITRGLGYLEENLPETTRPDFYLVTNGTLIDDEIAEELCRRKVRVGLSFDGVKRAQEARCPGTFQTLERLVADLRKNHPSLVDEFVTVSLTVWSGNLEDLADSVIFLHELGVASIALNPLMTHDRGWRPGLIEVLDEQIGRLFRYCRKHRDTTGKVPLLMFRRHRGERPPAPAFESRCSAADGGRIAVDTDGRIYPCVVLAQSFQSLPEGLLQSSVDALGPIWVSHAARPERLDAFAEACRRLPLFGSKIAMASSYGVCRDCRFLDSCFVCPASFGHIRGDDGPTRVPDNQCALNRVGLEYRENFPSQLHFLDLLKPSVRVTSRERTTTLHS